MPQNEATSEDLPAPSTSGVQQGNSEEKDTTRMDSVSDLVGGVQFSDVPGGSSITGLH